MVHALLYESTRKIEFTSRFQLLNHGIIYFCRYAGGFDVENLLQCIMRNRLNFKRPTSVILYDDDDDDDVEMLNARKKLTFSVLMRTRRVSPVSVWP